MYFQALCRDVFVVSTENITMYTRSMDDLRNKKNAFFLILAALLCSLLQYLICLCHHFDMSGSCSYTLLDA